MFWLPMLTQQCYSIVLLKVLDPKTENKIDDPNGKKKSVQVCNLNMSSRFEEFKTDITTNKFNNVIKKVGSLPM